MTDDKLAPLTDSDAIFDNIEEVFGITINAYMRSQIERLAAQMPSGYEDRAILLRNLDSEDGKTNIGLINFCMNALEAGSGYVYGATGRTLRCRFCGVSKPCTAPIRPQISRIPKLISSLTHMPVSLLLMRPDS